MEITLKIARYLPEEENPRRMDTFKLDVDPSERILDLLELVRGFFDETLGFRRSCAHGVCGSDAMRINGKNALACKLLVKDLGTAEITIEPVLGLRVIKDLIVDMEPFFENYRSVLPYFINDEPLPADGKERLQSPQERERFDDTTKCILCAACTTACPVFWSDGKYVGPAAIVNAHRYIFDSRDQAAAERLKILSGQAGAFRCRTAFNCTEACPRDIKITQAIGEVKRAMLSGKLD
ncbi:MAG TPA: succinate dehydrogenase iron-sulfur subunit [Anaerolineaceae bacterium]|nr:succinate dehydrogenase iron-sulfur subunit [Anaerolineaceae bacterium]